MSSKDLSFIEERDGLLERWGRKGSLLQTVFIGANVGLTFTGRVAKNGGSELRLVRGEDELSVNLLGARIEYIEKVEHPETAREYFDSKYISVLQITIDSGATCTIYELRNQQDKCA